jgi:hypothetical protein
MNVSFQTNRPFACQRSTMRIRQTCALPAGFHSGEHETWQSEAIVRTKGVRRLILAVAIAAWPTLAPAMTWAQQPFQPIAPGLPGPKDDHNGLGANPPPPIPDSSRQMSSTPAEKPVAPPQRPQQPPPTMR